MKKTYSMQDLECAACAAKMETAISRIPGVSSVFISFMTQKITIETNEEDHETIMEKANQCCQRVEKDCRIIW